MKYILIFFLVIIVIIIVGVISNIHDENAKEEAKRLEKIRKEGERRDIANKLSTSEKFKELESRIFVSDKNIPKQIFWDKEYSDDGKSDIYIEYDNFDNGKIPYVEVPDCIEFMRALGHKYQNEYTYSESTSTTYTNVTDKSTYRTYVSRISLYIKQKPKEQKTSW